MCIFKTRYSIYSLYTVVLLKFSFWQRAIQISAFSVLQQHANSDRFSSDINSYSLHGLNKENQNTSGRQTHTRAQGLNHMHVATVRDSIDEICRGSSSQNEN